MFVVPLTSACDLVPGESNLEVRTCPRISSWGTLPACRRGRHAGSVPHELILGRRLRFHIGRGQRCGTRYRYQKMSGSVYGKFSPRTMMYPTAWAPRTGNLECCKEQFALPSHPDKGGQRPPVAAAVRADCMLPDRP